MPANTDGPSPCGWHYVSTYLRCPRSWYLRNVLGLNPVRKKNALVFGHAWHTGLEALLNGAPPEVAVTLARSELTTAGSTLEKPEELPILLDRLDRGLPTWWSSFKTNYLDKGWVVQSTEDLRYVQIADGLTFSVRFDGTITDPDGRWYVLEHKTTGWSTDKTVQSVDLNDQVTGYYLAFNDTRSLGDPECSGVLLDVTEFKTSGITPSFWVVTRTHNDQVHFELGLVGLFTELAQKVAGLQDGHPPFELFPRSAEFCSVFGCEYETICRMRLEQLTLPPTEDFTVKAPDLVETIET